MDDFALHAEVVEDAFKQAGIVFKRIGRQRRIACHGSRLGQKMDRGQLEAFRAQ